MRVLITGGTGFVGSHIVKALQEAGHEVRLFVRDAGRIATALQPIGAGAVDHIEGEITDTERVRRAMEGCQAVIHAASIYSNDARHANAIRATNLAGARAVLGLAVARGLDPVVHVSSLLVLIRERRQVVNEDAPVGRPIGAYAASKVEQEVYARELQRAGSPVVITYPGAVFGPNDPNDGESTQVVRRMVRGLVPFIPRGTVPIVDVRDVAAAHAALLAPGQGPRRYVLGGHPVRARDLARIVHDEAGVWRPRMPIPAALAHAGGLAAGWAQRLLPFRLPIDPTTTWLIRASAVPDCTRAERELGISFRDPETTIRDQVRWQKSAGRL